MNVCLLVDLFDELFGNETTLLLQLSIILEFFNSFHVLLVLVNPRPANCNSLIELGESSTFEISSRFPEACLKNVGILERSSISECYLLSFRGASCPLRTILFSILCDNFYNAFFKRRLVHNDGLGLCLPKFFLALRTCDFSILLFDQIFQ